MEIENKIICKPVVLKGCRSLKHTKVFKGTGVKYSIGSLRPMIPGSVKELPAHTHDFDEVLGFY